MTQSKIIVFVLLILGCSAFCADFSDQVPALHVTDFVSRVEALTFADLVYRDDFGQKAMPDGWSLVRSGDGGLKDSPLRWALYERISDGQRVLSFAGTRSAADWADNVYSSGSFAPAQDLIRGSPELYKGLGLSPHFQYDQAYQKTLDELQANKYSGKGRPLVLAGDSKAGGEVEYVSSLTKTFGIARDAAPLGQDLLSRIPQENRKWANDGGVLRLELVSDTVSKLDFLPGSTHLGLKESYEVPKAWRDEYMNKAITPNLVESAVGMVGYTYFSHTERDLLLRAVMDKETTAKNNFSTPAKSFLPPSPNIAPPKDLPLPYHDDTRKYLPPRNQLYPGDPPRGTPAGIGSDDPHRKEQSPIPLDLDVTKRGGVLLRTDVTTNAPPSLDGVFGKQPQVPK